MYACMFSLLHIYLAFFRVHRHLERAICRHIHSSIDTIHTTGELSRKVGTWRWAPLYTCSTEKAYKFNIGPGDGDSNRLIKHLFSVVPFFWNLFILNHCPSISLGYSLRSLHMFSLQCNIRSF